MVVAQLARQRFGASSGLRGAFYYKQLNKTLVVNVPTEILIRIPQKSLGSYLMGFQGSALGSIQVLEDCKQHFITCIQIRPWNH